MSSYLSSLVSTNHWSGPVQNSENSLPSTSPDGPGSAEPNSSLAAAAKAFSCPLRQAREAIWGVSFKAIVNPSNWLSPMDPSGNDGVGVNPCSATKTLPLRINEMRTDNLYGDRITAKWIDRTQGFAEAIAAVFEEAKTDGMAQIG